MRGMAVLSWLAVLGSSLGHFPFHAWSWAVFPSHFRILQSLGRSHKASDFCSLPLTGCPCAPWSLPLAGYLCPPQSLPLAGWLYPCPPWPLPLAGGLCRCRPHPQLSGGLSLIPGGICPSLDQVFVPGQAEWAAGQGCMGPSWQAGWGRGPGRCQESAGGG